MAGEVEINGRTLNKAEMVCEVVDDLLSELVERSRRSDGMRNYYDVAILGYSGRGVRALLGSGSGSSSTIVEIDSAAIEERDVERCYTMNSGEKHYQRHRMRRWIEPEATGSTPMYEALLTTCDIVREWVERAENRESFPPIIFNITDGESTDCNYSDIALVASKIKALSTLDGQALLFNVHIASNKEAKSLIFPCPEEFSRTAYPTNASLGLFNASSELPQTMLAAAKEIKGVDYIAPFRAMSFNCSVAELVTILNIGSISVKRG